ncbi:MAG: primosomal protein N' [Candidatus Moranbacteria bacterium]|jgi:primosomal protein N' (replication factor Y)|nr:primosomal protein N' [Candidatus Moranbacteria bacterium]MBP9801715.1 primosomal protein N' [Candidatus Moranbacteria bacterium]
MPDTPFYRIEVAPLTILPLKRSPLFSYFSRIELPLGAIVSVPFGKQQLRGVVFACALFTTKPAFWIKEISTILIRNGLTEKQLRLAEQISFEYFTPLGKTLVHFLSDEIKTPLTSLQESLSPDIPSSHILASIQLKKILLPLLKKNPQALTIHPKDRALAIALLIKEKQKKAKTKESLLILVPEIFGAELLSAKLNGFGVEHTLLSSSLTRKNFLSAWNTARTPGTVFVGTRQALFAPFANLKTIILIDADDDAYKQWDMSPRYDGRRVSAMLATLFRAHLISVSSFLDTAQTHEKTSLRLTHTDLVSSLPLAPLDIVNLRLERYRKNYSPLSVASREHISHALIRKEKIVLIANQSGYSKITVCESCKKIFRCPECKALLHPEKSGFFSCGACAYKTPLFPSCFECGHLGLKQIGFGTERIEREIRKLFSSAKTQRIDKNTLEKKSARAQLIEQHITHEADIIIGVPSLLNILDDINIQTVVFIDADSMLTWSDFRTDERFALRIFRARLLAGSRGKVFLETFQPENIFLKKLATESYEHIEQTCREDRDLLSYPPFSRLINIEILRDTRTQADKTAKKLEESLRALPKSEKWRIFIQQASERHLRGKYAAHILLRIQEDTLPPLLTDWLLALPKDTFIDRDPLSIHV